MSLQVPGAFTRVGAVRGRPGCVRGRLRFFTSRRSVVPVCTLEAMADDRLTSEGRAFPARAAADRIRRSASCPAPRLRSRTARCGRTPYEAGLACTWAETRAIRAGRNSEKAHRSHRDGA